MGYNKGKDKEKHLFARALVRIRAKIEKTPLWQGFKAKIKKYTLFGSSLARIRVNIE